MNSTNLVFVLLCIAFTVNYSFGQTCTQDSFCQQNYPTRPHCSSYTGKCEPCNYDSDCQAFGQNKCLFNFGNFTFSCVGCGYDGDCRNASDCTATCSLATYKCVSGGVSCSGGTPYCDANSGVCTECKSDSDCQNKNPQKPACLSNGTCAECNYDYHCSYSNGTAGRPYCDSGNSYTCKKCVSDTNCRNTSNCNALCTGFQCVGGGTACTNGKVCWDINGTCVECNDDSHCSAFPSKPFCKTYATYANESIHICVPCLTDYQCRNKTNCNSTCNPTTNRCSSSGVSCTGACDASNGVCTECQTDSDCPFLKPSCDVYGGGKCVECLYDVYCANSTKGRFCSANHTCVPCYDNTHCRNITNCDGTCNTNSNQCVRGTLSCPTSCDIYTGTCSQCVYDYQCPNNRTCYSGSCVECSNDYNCRNASNCNGVCSNFTCTSGGLSCPSGICNAYSASCAECARDSDCKNAAKPVCNTFSGLCGECMYDYQCTNNTKGQYCSSNQTCAKCNADFACRNNSDCTATCINYQCRAGGLVCNSPSVCLVNAGQCGQCAYDSDCFGNPNGTYCDYMTSTCVECAYDSQCNASRSAQICDSSIHKCVQCTQDFNCQNDTNCAGTCASKKCIQGNLDCSLTGKHCAVGYSNGTGTCVECTNDIDCSGRSDGRLICDYTTNKCVVCASDYNCRTTTHCNSYCSNYTCVQGSLNCSPGGCNIYTSNCTECDSDSQCTSNPLKPHCNPFPGVCVQCMNDTQCNGNSNGPYCDYLNYVCSNTPVTTYGTGATAGITNGPTGSVTSNGVTSNGVTSNGVTSNGVTSNGPTSSGVTGNGSTSVVTGTTGSGTQGTASTQGTGTAPTGSANTTTGASDSLAVSVKVSGMLAILLIATLLF